MAKDKRLRKYFSKDQISEDPFLQSIEAGMKGLNQALSIGFDDSNHLGGYFEGINKATYILLAAMSGAGKTTFLDVALWNAYDNAIERGVEIRIVYYSFEINRRAKTARLLGMLLKKEMDIDLQTKTLLGMREGRIPDDALEAVAKLYPKVKRFMDGIEFIDTVVNPTGIYNKMKTMAEERGEFVYESFMKKQRDDHGNIEEVEKKRITGYKPKNPNEFVLLAMDHMSLIKKERTFSMKESIDKMSEYIIRMRNLFGYSAFISQQMNNSLVSAYRGNIRNVNQIDITPDQLDLSDSSYTFRDADIVLGLVKPSRFGMTAYKGKSIKSLGESFLIMYLMKHRYDAANKSFLFHVDQASSVYTALTLETLVDGDGTEDIDYTEIESSVLDRIHAELGAGLEDREFDASVLEEDISDNKVDIDDEAIFDSVKNAQDSDYFGDEMDFGDNSEIDDYDDI